MPDTRRRLLLAGAGLGSAALGLRSLAAAGTAGHADGIASDLAPDQPFRFGFIGDTPYSRLEENALRRVIDALSEERLEFVLHVGDLKSSAERCDDDLLSARIGLLAQCAHPLILTPGDNDWTDCGRSRSPWEPGGRLERLQWLRRHVYGEPRSLGLRPMALGQQSPPVGGPILPAFAEAVARPSPGLPENLRWRVGSLQFCSLHVVGSNNAPRHAPDLARAWSLRQQANGAWLEETVELAIRQRDQGLVRGLAIAMHANMQFDAGRSDGWEQMRQLVVAAAVAFDGPVLLLHGDTHHFRADRLLWRSHGLANFHRVECFGSPFSSSWVQVRWNPAQAAAGTEDPPNPFQVSIHSLP